MAEGFSISTTFDHGVARVCCLGSFEPSACDKLEDALDLCASRGLRRVVVDLAEAAVTPGCVEVLTAAAADFAGRGVHLALRLSARQRRALGLAAIDAIVPIGVSGSVVGEPTPASSAEAALRAQPASVPIADDGLTA